MIETPKPKAVEVVAKITIVLLPTGQVLSQIEPPLPEHIALGIIEQAKIELHEAVQRQRAGGGIQIAPPGMSVERNGD